jgi:MFS_1 like family
MSRPSALWVFLTTYALLYGAFGMQSPFVPALLRERGLQAQDIGLVLAAAMVVRVLAGTWPAASSPMPTGARVSRREAQQ